MSVPAIVPLARAARYIDALAQAHVRAFGALQPDWDVAAAAAELRSHLRVDGPIPATWVALDDDGWHGSVSLLHDDHPSITGYSPWLASLYVRADARGRGTGAALLAQGLAAARAAGVARLFLYCEPQLQPYYLERGWATVTRFERLPLPPVLVMAIDIAPASGRRYCPAFSPCLEP